MITRKKVLDELLNLISSDFLSICCEDLYDLVIHCFSACSIRRVEIYMISFCLSFVIAFLIELKLLPIFVFAIMKYKYHLVVTDKMKNMIMNKKYKSERTQNMYIID